VRAGSVMMAPPLAQRMAVSEGLQPPPPLPPPGGKA
jgi:hypothetical protein